MPDGSPIRIQFGLRGWAAIAAALALFAAITFLAVGLFIFVLPVLFIASTIYWLLPKPRPKPNRVGGPVANEPANGATVIDGEFRVIEADASEGHKPLS
jgi:hypothetical protein